MLDESNYEKPLPVVTATNAPYWEGLRERQVRLQRCDDCGGWIWPIAPVCQSCWSERHTWVTVSGAGRISSWVRYHKAFDSVYANDVPYNVIQVDLAEGVRLISNLVAADESSLRSGLAVEPVFHDVTPERTLLKFRPSGEVR
jgi:uncharacterized OB-fold protein